MHVAVLGAGVVGVTTAYYLAELGCRVTIIERAPSVATATSYANGAQLSYSYTDSLARPEFLPRIPSLVLGLDPAVRVGLWRNWRLFSWGLSFVGQCTHRKARDNTLAVLALALRSGELLNELRDKLEIDFAYRRAGKLVVLADLSDIAGAKERSRLKRQHGCVTEIVTYDEALSLEPALADMQQKFAGAIYSDNDEVGDAHAFSQALISWLVREKSVQVRCGEPAAALEFESGAVKAVQTSKDVVPVDAAVVCLGPWSDAFLRCYGIRANIYPVRGYSVTLPHGTSTPTVSITNLANRIVFSRLPEGVRIAGFADFVGEDVSYDDERVARLLATAERIAPQAAEYGASESRSWGGFRPVTPDSRPVVGATRIPGLYVNVGHGVLGWTLACATAHSVAKKVVEGGQ